MDMYLKAAMLKLRFPTPVGELKTEELFDLNIKQLDKLVVSLQIVEDKSLKKTFITDEDVPATDETPQLRFDIANDILQMKLKDRKKLRDEAENKKHNQMIDELIAEKEGEELKGKSIEQLKALRK